MHRPFRRHLSATDEPRFELVPLLDCVFQLLIFSLYCLTVTVYARVLPVELPMLGTGDPPARGAIAGITVDSQGRFFLNQDPVTRAELETRVRELAAQPDPPQFYLGIDTAEGAVDRAPLLIETFEMFRRLKLSVTIVGRPKPDREPSGTGDATVP